MTLGVPANIPVPPATPALPVQDTDMPRIEAARDRYRKATDAVDASLAKVAELEQQRALVQQVTKDNEARLTAAEQKTANDQATALIAKLDRQLADERARARAAQARVNAAVGGIESLQDYLSKRYSIGSRPDPKNHPEFDAYLRGIQDASTCGPKGASDYCHGKRACMDNY